MFLCAALDLGTVGVGRCMFVALWDEPQEGWLGWIWCLVFWSRRGRWVESVRCDRRVTSVTGRVRAC